MLVWVVRPYGVQIMQGVSLLIAVGIIVYVLVFKKYLQSLERNLFLFLFYYVL